MPITFYNSLTHQAEPFEPLTPPVVRMYSCGPTVYDYAHIGNFRSFLFADIVRRLLELTGHEVRHVMNITDVGHMTEDNLADGGGEDKMALAARRLLEDKKAGKVPDGAIDDPNDPYQVAGYYTRAFLEDARGLGLKVADEYPDRMPHATQHVAEMQAMIEKLIAHDHAYVADDGAVYYRVESFPGYGRLSGNTLDQLRGGAGGRVSAATQSAKRHPADFLLWKPDPSHLMKWDSPWGAGYPGWHIECSAMAMAVLEAETIDIHTGGEDNIFPHHECEIAQSCGATGRDRFAKVWLHGRFLMVEGEKMSKSKGNFYTARDVLAGRVTGEPVDPAVLRFELVRTHYRQNANFTAQGLRDGAGAVMRYRRAHAEATAAAEKVSDTFSVDDHPVVRRFVAALSGDVNVSGAIGEVFAWLGAPREAGDDDPATTAAVLERVDAVLGLLPAAGTADTAHGDTDIDDLVRQLDAARAAKDFDTADALRQQILDAGYLVRTTKDGTVAEKQLA